jgi:23S rRNA pseudouridine1911/1915/1917 synthase
VKRPPGQSAYTALQVSPREDGIRLDVFLSRRFKRSRSIIHQVLKDSVAGSDGFALKWSHRVRPGETIQIQTIARPEPEVEVTYRLLYEDEWIVVVDKGAGAPVHPSRSYKTRTIVTRLRADLGDDSLNPAHRLDRETSGVLLFGRGPKMVKALMSMFKDAKVEKRYLAVVYGQPGFESLRLEAPIGKDPDFPISCRMMIDKERGRTAVTNFESLSRHGSFSLIAAKPETGRQHQIRVHLAHLGLPVVGDKLYLERGKPYLDMVKGVLDAQTLGRLGHHRQALHADSIEFRHPASGESLRLRAPLPPDLQELIVD